MNTDSVQQLKNEPAFPSNEDAESHLNVGMSLRDYFAAKAMQALIASPNFEAKSKPHQVAQMAYCTADAMLAHRSA